MMNLKKLLFQHSEPLRFTQSRWTNGKEANYLRWYQNILWKKFFQNSIILYITENVVLRSYLVYKCVFGLFLFANLIQSLAHFSLNTSQSPHHYFSKYCIYATNWNMVLITLAFNFDTILVMVRYIIEQKSQKEDYNQHYNKCHPLLKVSMALTGCCRMNFGLKTL